MDGRRQQGKEEKAFGMIHGRSFKSLKSYQEQGPSGCQEAGGNSKLSFAGLADSPVILQEHLSGRSIMIDRRNPIAGIFPVLEPPHLGYLDPTHQRRTT